MHDHNAADDAGKPINDGASTLQQRRESLGRERVKHVGRGGMAGEGEKERQREYASSGTGVQALGPGKGGCSRREGRKDLGRRSGRRTLCLLLALLQDCTSGPGNGNRQGYRRMGATRRSGAKGEGGGFKEFRGGNP